jgi:hypothetical protein
MTTLEQLVTTHQQQSCGRLRSILMRAAAEIEALTFPAGEPNAHYDQDEMARLILDMLPTWTPEDVPEISADDRAFDVAQQRNDAMRELR